VVLNLLLMGEEVAISAESYINASQIGATLLAIPSFVPVTICTGYLAAWFSNLHNFRRRSLIERLFWSVPLSLAISTIAAYWIGRFISVTAASFFFLTCALGCIGVLLAERVQLRREGRSWNVGWHPHGTTVLVIGCAWVAIAILSLVDFNFHQHSYMTVAMYDHGARVSWIDAILRTGIPPVNPNYQFLRPSIQRNYYFWYVDCAVVSRLSNLPAFATLYASCVWSGIALASLFGLYLKYFLEVGDRLRRQFLICLFLLSVTGLDLLAVIWTTFFVHMPLPPNLEGWSSNAVLSWFNSLTWVPHHIASLLCCLLAFLLAWLAGRMNLGRAMITIVFSAAAMASAFGLSVYVAFAFFLLMVAWGAWQLIVERAPRSVGVLAAGGLAAGLMLTPYLWELTHTSSYLEGGGLFSFAVREMLPPNGLMATSFLRECAIHDPVTARNLANLILLVPGYVLEFGYFLVVFVIFLVPRWRGRTPLTPAHRVLLFFCIVMLPTTTFLRSSVLHNNDFGFRSVLFVQFALLLLASELLAAWGSGNRSGRPQEAASTPRWSTPKWLRGVSALTLLIGILCTICQAMMQRFALPMMEGAAARLHNPAPDRLSRTVYASVIGYGQLNRRISKDVVVQYNPALPNEFFRVINLAWINHQSVVESDREGCGSTLGGDARGCPIIAAALDAVFNGSSAEQALGACHEFGIQYLVATIDDPAWRNRSSWVWRLRPVVADQDFRALDCR